jgi:hypothetical protein
MRQRRDKTRLKDSRQFLSVISAVAACTTEPEDAMLPPADQDLPEAAAKIDEGIGQLLKLKARIVGLAGGAAPGATDDDHPGIPRDANGDPIFLILPDGVRAKYQARLTACEAAWRERGDPLVVSEATSWTHMHRQPIPAWLEQATVELAMALRSDDQAKRHAELGLHLVRYITVRDLKVGTPGSNGRYIPPAVHLTWDEAREQAAELLAGTPAGGSADTMKSSYAIVKRDLKARHAGKHFTLKDRRYRRNGRPPLG